MSSRIAAALLLGCIGSGVSAVQSQGRGVLLVLAKADRTLAIVDPATGAVTARVPSGPDPHEVVASADGRLAFISNYNGGNNILTVVDLTAPRALAPIDLGPLRAPHGLAFAGGKVWFTAEAAKAIGSIDPATMTVDWVLGTGQNRTHMIHVSTGLDRIVTSNVSSATMTIIEKTTGGGQGRGGADGRGVPGGRGAPDALGSRGGRGVPDARGPGGRGAGPAADWDETVIPVGRGVEGFDVSPDAKEIWAANAQDGTISIIDTAAKKVTATLDANVGGANRLKFTPDGKLVLVSTLRGSDLTILDAATRRTVKRLNVGRGAAGIEMQPDGLRAYVACTPDDYVAIVDLTSLEVAGHIDAGKQPDGLAWVVRK